MPIPLHSLQSQLEQAKLVHPLGRVIEIQSGILRISGLEHCARIGDAAVVHRQTGTPLKGEILQIDTNSVSLLPDSAPTDVALQDRVRLRRAAGFAPDHHWIGRVIDPFGIPLDGKPLMPGSKDVDIMSPPPPAAARLPLGERINTGLAILNTLLPIVEGQRLGLFAGSGIGKSRLLGQLARNMQSDVVVVALIGERGREVNEIVTQVLGAEGMARSVVVAATSDQSALTRRRCAWAAMAVAEFFQRAGRNVLFLADSVTRFAEAHREIAVASGEAPALRGYPPSVTPLITGLCERSGPGRTGQGHITAVFSVLVAGSDMEEPIADILRGVLDGHVVLNRDIAERGRFPAIDVGKSVSRSLPEAATRSENALILDARRYLGAYEASEIMIKAGLYVEGADQLLDKAVRVWPELDQFFARSESGSIRDSFDRLDLTLRRAMGPADR